jgi:hypothetical protein
MVDHPSGRPFHNAMVVDGRGNAYISNLRPGILALVTPTGRLGKSPMASPSPTAWP